MKTLVPLVVLLTLAACSLPQTTVRTGAAQPGLVVEGAPADAALFVDGIAMGAARQYDGKPRVLAVLEGVHTLEIRQGAKVIFQDKALFTSGETHPIRLLPSAVQQ